MGTLKVLNFKVEGMHCGSCINHIENVVKPLGAITVDINLTRHFGRITFDDDDLLGDVFIDAINNAGYIAEKLAVMKQTDLQ